MFEPCHNLISQLLVNIVQTGVVHVIRRKTFFSDSSPIVALQTFHVADNLLKDHIIAEVGFCILKNLTVQSSVVL